jgi:DNA topoisomerase-1
MSFSPFHKKKFTKYPKKFFPKKSEKGLREVPSSATYLVIVESPSKCEKIESFLGEKYHCIASKGHIRNIDGLKSIHPKENFHIEFTNIEEKKQHIENMKKTISQFQKENIILATDDDREGEAIAWHICQVFDLDVLHTKRILFREVTKPALLAAVEKPTILNLKLVYAQHARQVLDMIVGYKISPLLWKFLYSNKENSLSAGRCQTPALRLVYDKEKSDSKKEMKMVYKTTGSFFQENMIFELSKDLETKREMEDYLEKSKVFPHILSISPLIKKETGPPKPFNTSNLLQTVSNHLHISPKETMSLCQQLYQDGYITYMRTDSVKYSASFITEVTKYIQEKYDSPHSLSSLKKSHLGNLSNIENKDETNPHEAIRVTHLEYNSIPSENPRLSSLYKLIWRNTVESCMSNYEYNVRKAMITAPDQLQYINNIEIPLFLGWKKVVESETSSKTETQNSGAGMLLFLESVEKSGKPVKYNYIKSNISVRNTEHHYTEASLIKELETYGIGRPSTFASIIDTIQERGYVKRMDIEGKPIHITQYELKEKEITIQNIEKTFGKEKNKLVIQPLGILSCEFLISHFENLFSYDYTKDLELELDEIACGTREKWYETCEKCTRTIKEQMKKIDIQKPEFKIDEEHTLVYEKYGPVIRVNNDTEKEGKKEKEGKEKKEGTKKNEYKYVKKDIIIDLEKVKRGEYKLEDLLEIEESSLGKYEEEEVFLKNGKYGWYVQWGSNTQSIKDLEKNTPIESITIEQIIQFIEKKSGTISEKSEGINRSILRVFTPNLSLRKGKYGNYIFYKRENMQSPQFFNLKGFKGSPMMCDKNLLVDWINEKYKINECEFI